MIFSKIESATHKRISLLIIFILFLYIFWLLYINLENFTGLHRDEAWFGLNALRITEEGIFSIHGMNRYTSSLYSIILAIIFKTYGVNVFNLRLFSVLINYISLTVVAINSYRHNRLSGIWTCLVIIFSSAYFFLFSRLAWEVCSLQFLLIAIQIWIISRLIETHHLSIVSCFIYLLTVLIGVNNHFIFVSNILGLLTAVFSIRILGKEDNNSCLVDLSYLAISSLAICLYIYIFKPLISDVFFQSYRWLTILIVLLPAGICTGLFFFLRHHAYGFGFKAFRLSLRNIFQAQQHNRLLALTVAIYPVLYIFSGRHIWGFFGAITGFLPLQRILLHHPSLWELIISHISWAFLLLLFMYTLAGHLLRIATLTHRQQSELLWYFYPICSLVLLSILTTATASRHYLISFYLILCCIPLIQPSPLSRLRGTALLCFAAVIFINILTNQIILNHELLSNQQGAPVEVHYPSFFDYSSHFLKQDQLLQFLSEHQVCDYGKTNQFIKDSLAFSFQVSPYTCNPRKQALVEYCPRCQHPVPYFSVSISDETNSTE